MKLLGDRAMLRFPEPVVGVDAALDLVETMNGERALAAHAGPVVERDLDVFGRTVKGIPEPGAAVPGHPQPPRGPGSILIRRVRGRAAL